MKPLHFTGLLGFLGVVIAGGLVWQHRVTTNLRVELTGQKRAVAEEKWVKAEQARLLAHQVSPEELARRREEREAWITLVAEIKTLRDRTETKKAVPETKPAASQPRSLRDAPLAAAEWREAGQSTPAAAFETVLWAAAGGEVEKLAAGLELDDATRASAATIFDRLPPALRREVGTPEQLVALLTARDVPLGSAWIRDQFTERPQESRVVAQLTDLEGKKRDLLFTAREREGRWRLVVPPQVMAKYTAFLQGRTVEAAP